MRSPGAAFDLRAALTEELNAAIDELNSPSARPKAVHRCRVRLKRARALARVGKACAPGLADVFNDSARAVMTTLAQARDLTALSEAARTLAKESDKNGARALLRAAESLDEARAALPELDIEAVRAELKKLQALALVWPETSARQIRKGAQRIALRARRACARGHGSPIAMRRHEWRKREKDRFYAALLLDGDWPGKRRRKIGARLGDVLGEERDALLLIERIAHDPALAGEGKRPKQALKALRRSCARLGKRADSLGARLHGGGA
jgi:hypothetical protein